MFAIAAPLLPRRLAQHTGDRKPCRRIPFYSTASRAPISFRRVRNEMGDRKSTRLNSSHLVISYAVFCLKKKKKETLPSKTVVCGQTGFHSLERWVPLA